MSFPTFLSYFRALSPRIPLEHWWVLLPVSFAVSLLFLLRKETSKYGAIVCGVTVLLGLFLLDALAIKRLWDGVERMSGFDLMNEYQRIVNGSDENRLLLLFNFVVFVPFGCFLSETLSELKHYNPRQCLRVVFWITFGLSFCIEMIQLVLRVGVFEVTDLVLNTLGATMGAGVALGMRRVFLKEE